MKKIVIVPDSFKGTMSSDLVCKTLKKEILNRFPATRVFTYPIADGGEGTCDCFIKYFGYQRVNIRCVDHQNNSINTYYAFKDKEILIECAKSNGITLTSYLNPYTSSTYGVGLMILDSIKRFHPKKITLSLGGSATNDMGVGMLLALGAKFYNNKEPFIPTPLTIGEITDIDLSVVEAEIRGIEIFAMCDVKNPLCGTNGATYSFGPQKKVEPQFLDHIDKGFMHFAALIKKKYNKDYINLEGAGAAGGLGYAARAFLNARLKSGIDIILDTISFNNLIKDADYVITGEGRLDMGSLNGKAVGGILARCKKENKRLIVLCGSVAPEIYAKLEELGIYMVAPISKVRTPYYETKRSAIPNLILTINQIMDDLD